MTQGYLSAVPGDGAVDEATAWAWLLALRTARGEDLPAPRVAPWGLGFDGLGRPARVAPFDAAVVVEADGRWRPRVSLTPTARQLLDLYLEMARAGPHRPWVVGHLGQSVDGRIATACGDSCWVTGPENLTHLHRLRALGDAVIVGAETARCDNPRLTTRRVPGPHPVRVVLDGRRRLPPDLGLFCDGAAPTLVVCREAWRDGDTLGQAEVVGIADDGDANDGLAIPAVVAALQRRGLFGLLVEGGGVTVSRFLQAGCLHRLQLTVAPLILGSGRPALQLPPIERLADGLRPPCRHFAMGGDVLFDLAVAAEAKAD
ncbi:MAG: RibD family protein, partial [Candidatus Competibacterales bacterium]